MKPIRSMFAFDPTIDAERFARACSEWGTDTPILHPGFFRDERTARALDREGLALWLNLPVFYDPPYLESHPESYAMTNRGRPAVQDWLHFACPSREEHLDQIVKDVRDLLPRLQPAVVSLDFIRHFVFWERVELSGSFDVIEDGCYCPICLSSFERDCGEKLDREDAAAYIRAHLRKQWGDWKCRSISVIADRLFAEVRSLTPEAKLAVKTVPWRESDLGGAIRSSAGQDVRRLATDLDIMVPMAFTHILGQTPEWKADLLAHVREITGKPVLSYVQTESVDRSEAITLSQFEEELTVALAGDHAGIVVFHYEQLAASPEKAAILRKHLR
jgi:hypothetical protein